MSINIISNLKGYRKKKSSGLSLGRKSCDIWPCYRAALCHSHNGPRAAPECVAMEDNISNQNRASQLGFWDTLWLVGGTGFWSLLHLEHEFQPPRLVTSPLGASSLSTVIKIIIVLIASVFQMHHELDIHDRLQSSQPFQEAKWRLDLQLGMPLGLNAMMTTSRLTT